MNEVLILSMPRIAPVRPPAAMGVIKSICNSANKNSLILDFNLDFFTKFTENNLAAAKEIDDYFIVNQKLQEQTQKVYNSWLDSCVKKILEQNSNLLIVSVFSWQSQRSVEDLLTVLRPQYQGTILIGGQGLTNSQNLSSHWAPKAEYAERLYNKGIIDYW